MILLGPQVIMYTNVSGNFCSLNKSKVLSGQFAQIPFILYSSHYIQHVL